MTTKLLNIKTRLFRSLTNLGMMIILFSCSSSSIGEEPINPPAPPASSVEKSEYYVSTTGNDENPGTLTSPWRTIQKAVTTVTPGCIVNIMGGTYYEEIKVTVSGLSLIHISEPTRQAEISYAVFCLKKKKKTMTKPHVSTS